MHNKPPGTGGTQIDELVADVVGLLRVELGGHQYVGVVFPYIYLSGYSSPLRRTPYVTLLHTR